jgi:hypothetical protein
MDVPDGARAVVVPRRAAVGREHQGAELDPNQDAGGVNPARTA